jgi:transposase
MNSQYLDIPDELWNRIEKWIPQHTRNPMGGRSRLDDRIVMAGIFYRTQTGCQWDAIPDEFGSGSTCYRRFGEWQKAGVFRMMYVEALLYYDEKLGIDLKWCSLDSCSVKAPKGGIIRVPIPPTVASWVQSGMC